MEYNIGETVLVKCIADGNPLPEIILWRVRTPDNNNGHENDKHYIDSKDGTLKINSLKLSDEGIYACMASNKFGNDVQQISIKVKKTQKCFYQNVICQSICENGQEICSCPPGYFLSDDKEYCQDIDECNKSFCDQKCENLPGSYRCLCENQYDLATDGHSCYSSQKCNENDLECYPICQRKNGTKICECNLGFRFYPENNNCIRENISAFSVFSTFTPLVLALGVLGIAIIVIVLIIVGVIMTLRSNPIEN
uniref:Fibulin-2 (Trinotate prediction) n=1 Tax=Myxobolus squamalis TaxID=59785 RepID=A0A6B2G385_MYXSQ